ANEFYSLHPTFSLLRQDNAHRVYRQSVASIDLVAVQSLASQAYIAIEDQLAIGKGKATRVLWQIPLDDNRLKLRFLVLFEGFKQRGNLLPGNALWIGDTYSFFPLAIRRRV